MERKMIVALNHKSNFTKDEILKYLEDYKNLNTYNHEMILIPSVCYLPLIPDNITYASEDVSSKTMGAYTGEVTAKAIKSLGATYTLINHSERTTKMNENLDVSKQKLEQAFSNDLIPIICIGDTLEEHEKGTYVDKIKKDMDYLLSDIDNSKDFIIAYEPIFAIGTGIVPTNDDIEKVTTMLKETYHKKVLYGGSANENNIDELKQVKNIDGFLLGGISLKLSSLQEFLDKLQ